MTLQTTIYGIHYPQLSDTPPDISALATSFGDIDTLVSKIDAGSAMKPKVVAVATVNINLGVLPPTIDGVTMNTGDLFLCTAQTSSAQNGLQKWTSFGGVAVRPTGFTSGAAGAGQVTGGHLVVGGMGGTNNGGVWQCINTGAITVDTTAILYTKIAGAQAIGTSNIADVAITAAKIAGTLKPSVGAAPTDEALRALGATINTAAAGNDARFPTTTQKDALVGTGTPSTSNKFVTKDTLDTASREAGHAAMSGGTFTSTSSTTYQDVTGMRLDVVGDNARPLMVELLIPYVSFPAMASFGGLIKLIDFNAVASFDTNFSMQSSVAAVMSALFVRLRCAPFSGTASFRLQANGNGTTGVYIAGSAVGSGQPVWAGGVPQIRAIWA